MTLTVQDVEAQRLSRGWSRFDLCAVSGVTRSQYERLLQSRHVPRKGTLARLVIAMRRLSNGYRPGAEQPLQVFRLALTLCALQAEMDPAVVLQHDPTRRATANKEWLAAAQVRRRALYIAHVCCGVSQAVLAKVSGMTPAAVSLAIVAIEEARGETDDDAIGVIERVMQLDA